jgi:ribosomal protein S18 acetylase RimI-like enzyme
MRTDDIAAVTAVHLAAFPGFFLTFMGGRFVREVYDAILADEETIAFVAVDGERIAGFVAGSTSGGLYRRATGRRWLRFGLASLGAVLRRPWIAVRLLRALWAPPGPSVEGAPLISLAVDPRLQGSGAGKLLTGTFVDEARRRGARAVVLTTDRHGNDAVNAFYRAQGFEVTREFVTPEGRAMNEYILYI